MESPTRLPQALSPCGSGRSRLSTDSNSNSPEFDFWRLQEPSLPKSDLLSADQLFSDGVLLPLSLVTLPHPDRDPPSQPAGSGEEKTSEETRVVAEAGPPTASKRWRDIFKKAEKKPEEESNPRSEKKKKEKRRQGGSGSAELNINIWPFWRSRSTGNSGCRPRAGVARKASSAPCSRSNSAGENKTRKWPSSPGRPGVHLGRTSPVWQVRRTSIGGPNSSDPILRTTGKASTGKDTSDGAPRSKAAVGSGRGGGRAGGGEAKARVLNLNVPMCIGYRQHLSCSQGGDKGVVIPGTGNGCNRSLGGVESVVGSGSSTTSSHFNLRSLFTRKVF